MVSVLISPQSGADPSCQPNRIHLLLKFRHPSNNYSFSIYSLCCSAVFSHTKEADDRLLYDSCVFRHQVQILILLTQYRQSLSLLELCTTHTYKPIISILLLFCLICLWRVSLTFNTYDTNSSILSLFNSVNNEVTFIIIIIL